MLWEGSATGTTHRYGKRNDENVNEVLSDALKEAYANAFSDPGLQQAASGKGSATGGGTGSGGGGGAKAAEGISPAQLLAELADLKKQGFATDMLVGYVNQKTLNAEMTAKDLGQWKQAGMPQEVIKAALARSPGAGKP